MGTTDVAQDSTLGGLLNRSALMDVPFRGMQRQHTLVYLAALEEPGSTGLDTQINFQGFPGADQPEYEDFGVDGVSNSCEEPRLGSSLDVLHVVCKP